MFGQKSILDDIVIASPCPVEWSDMEGDDRVRFCSRCELNVFNISDMSTKEAEAFLESNFENACLRFFRRRDGTLITNDCPLGKRVVDGFRMKARAITLALLAFFNASAAFGSDSNDRQDSCNPKKKIPFKTPEPTVLDERGGYIRISKDEKSKPITSKKDPPELSSYLVKANKNKTLANSEALNAYVEARRNESKGDIPGASVCYQNAIDAIRISKVKFDSEFVLRVAKAYAKNLRQVGLETKAREIEREFVQNHIRSMFRPSPLFTEPNVVPDTDK